MDLPEVFVDMGEHRLHFEPKEMGTAMEEKALKELRETPELRQESLTELRNKIKEKGELELRLDDDVVLLAFLRTCKFYPDSSYKRLVDYYKFTAKHPKMFNDLTPSRDSKPLKQNIFCILPSRDKEGRRLLLIQPGNNWNVKEVSLNELVRSLMLIIMGALVEPKTQVAGATVIIDLKGLTITHAWQFSPSTAKVLLEYIQECVPIRIKAIHILNHPTVFNMIFSIFKPFMNEKIRNRIHFHGDDKTDLRNVVGAKFLPTQYGGDMNFETVYGEKVWEMFHDFENFYKLALENQYIPPTKK